MPVFSRINFLGLAGATALLLCASFIARAQESSIFATGTWYRIPITRTGAYQLNYEYLQSLGIDPAQIDPAHIQLFGRAGTMLPQALTGNEAANPPEIAIEVTGSADGRFDPGDRILFFAQGPDEFTYDAVAGHYTRERNLYSRTRYVHLTVSGAAGLRVAPTNEPAAVNPSTLTSFPDYAYHESDTRSHLQSGRVWYGEAFYFSSTPLNLELAVPGLVPNSEARLLARVMAESYGPVRFNLSLQGSLLGQIPVSAVSTREYTVEGRENQGIFTLASLSPGESDAITTTVQFEPANVSRSNGFLDYLLLTYERQLALSETGELVFHTYREAGTAVRMPISGATPSLRLWAIDSAQQPQAYPVQTSQSVGVATSANLSGHRFVAFNPGQVPTPAAGSRLQYTDVLSQGTPQYLIVSHPDFMAQAQRLADFHANHDGLTSLVVSSRDVFTQFSDGQRDPSGLRNFVRHLYRQSPTTLRYLLLVGKGSYDYLNRVDNNTNFIPLYQSYNSLHPVDSYTSDDYYGFLEVGEGRWSESPAVNHTLDIGVGRLPVLSAAEAEVVVDKIIHYATSPATLGPWRQHTAFVADDGDGNLHQQDAEELSRYLDTAQAALQLEKLYLDRYVQTPLGNGETSAAAKQALNEAIFKGALMVNYTGHGSERAWAAEGMFTNPQIEDWTNYDRLPVFVTATCQFGRHDNPGLRSGGELLLVSPQGGAIALLTTARNVNASSNFAINKVFYEQAFRPSTDGSPSRLGDILRETKNRSLRGVDNRNFILLGDPALRLGVPEEAVVLTQVNGRALSQGIDTLAAGRKVRLSGEIRTTQGVLDEAFKGTLWVTLSDKPAMAYTRGTAENTPMAYQLRSNTLFRGQATVDSGRWSVEFMVPRNLDYRTGLGRLHLYAADTRRMVDAQGVSETLPVGGSAVVPPDALGPELTLHLNDSSFVAGGLTSPNPVLLVSARDASGISLTQSAVGQGFVGWLDEGEPFALSTFYTSLPDDFTTGTARYPLHDLADGEHTLTVKVFDTFNNVTQRSIPFLVSSQGALTLREVFNYPNPASQGTTFRFEHNRAGEPLLITVSVFSSRGDQVASIQWEVNEGQALIDGLYWEGNTDRGLPLPSGLYLYQIEVEALTDGAKKEAYGKLVLVK